jgi:hypothetical protein
MKDNFSMHEWLLNEKIKGIDGKPCWKGYRYAGTENGKDKCVPIKETMDDDIKKNINTYKVDDDPYEVAKELGKKYGWDEKKIEKAEQILRKKYLKENEDHEVSMSQASLKSIISSASQLMNKLGNDERNIPGWIQDHIVNAENYIDQANQGFHELDNEYEED